jgi:hypothetical protein
MVNTITEKQVTFLNKLQLERDLTDCGPSLEFLRQHYREERATSKEASAVISVLMGAPKRAVFDRHDLQAGVYDTGEGRLVRVYLGQNSGHMLSKEVYICGDGSIDYVYLGLASANIPPTARRLPREEVAERTLALGSTTCLVCGRGLDVPESVDRGIGPVCWENYS